MEQIGIEAHHSSTLAGRNEINYIDIFNSFQSLNVDIKRLIHFAQYSDVISSSELSLLLKNNQFDIPKITLVQGPDNDNITDNNIPNYLPKYTAKRTYQKTIVYNQRVDDNEQIKQQKIKEARKIEDALTDLYAKKSKIIKLK